MGRNKHTICMICLRTMRKDHLKGHMKKHEGYNEDSLQYESNINEIVNQD